MPDPGTPNTVSTTPEATKKPDAKKDDSSGGGWPVAIGLAAILWFTNPSGPKHGKALGVDGIGANAVVGLMSLIAGAEIKYNNYYLFSTVSVNRSDGTSKTASFGILGFVKTFE